MHRETYASRKREGRRVSSSPLGVCARSICERARVHVYVCMYVCARVSAQSVRTCVSYLIRGCTFFHSRSFSFFFLFLSFFSFFGLVVVCGGCWKDFEINTLSLSRVSRAGDTEADILQQDPRAHSLSRKTGSAGCSTFIAVIVVA